LAAGVAAALVGTAPLLVEGLTEGDVDDDDDDEAGGDAFFLVLVGGRGGGGGGAMTGLAWGIVATFSDDMAAVVGPLAVSLSVQFKFSLAPQCVCE
jgi:branched-subunit amino acid ABC-type transport system permease component